MKALSRRNAGYSDLVLSFGDVQLDCNRYELSCKEQTVRLNNKEFQLTELFLQHPHFVFSSNHLMDKIWGQDSEADMNVVWTYIGFVRKNSVRLEAAWRYAQCAEPDIRWRRSIQKQEVLHAQKMQRRFIMAAMAAFATVMLVLVVGINIVNYYRTTATQDGLAASLFGV